jgi:hypothetical protein
LFTDIDKVSLVTKLNASSREVAIMSHRICANPHHEITPAAHKSMGRWAGEAGLRGTPCGEAAIERPHPVIRGVWDPYDVFFSAFGNRRGA